MLLMYNRFKDKPPLWLLLVGGLRLRFIKLLFTVVVHVDAFRESLVSSAHRLDHCELSNLLLLNRLAEQDRRAAQ